MEPLCTITLNMSDRKWKEPRVLELHAVTPPVTSPTERAAHHRNDGTVQILNMFWHNIKSCSPLWGRDSPFFVWSLIRPLGEWGRNTDTWIFSLHFLWHFLADLGITSHCEISFRTKIEALISPHLKLMKSHQWSMRIPVWVACFICLIFSLLVSKARFAVVPFLMIVIQKLWQLCSFDSERWATSNNPENMRNQNCKNLSVSLKADWLAESWRHAECMRTNQPTNPINQNSWHLTSFCHMTMVLRGE